MFAPSQGSADAETNPSETLFESLEQSSSRSLLQYLAYLDLCLVCESNIDTWRRAAFFEETGETYRRIISLCLRPLEQLVSRLGQVFEGVSGDKSGILCLQITSSTSNNTEMKLREAFDDFQVSSDFLNFIYSAVRYYIYCFYREYYSYYNNILLFLS